MNAFLYTSALHALRRLLAAAALLAVIAVVLTPHMTSAQEHQPAELIKARTADAASTSIRQPSDLEGLTFRIRLVDESTERWLQATVVDGQLVAEGDIVLGAVDDTWTAIAPDGSPLGEAALAAHLALPAGVESLAASDPDAPINPIVPRTPTPRTPAPRTPTPSGPTRTPTSAPVATEPAECRSLSTPLGTGEGYGDAMSSTADSTVPEVAAGWSPQEMLETQLVDSGIYGFAREAGSSRWANGTVPFVLDANLTTEQRQIIASAIADWEARTPLTFVARNNQADWVRFTRGTGCSSNVGRVGGEQVITLQWTPQDNGKVRGCFVPQATHEIGHAIGLWHEHTRPDRDAWVNINWSNVKPDARGNFCKQSGQLPVGSYDLASIMHYRGWISDPAIVINTDKPTITDKQGNAVGANDVLSAGDIATVASLYGRTPFVRLQPGRPIFGQPVSVVVTAVDPVTGQAIDSALTLVTYARQTGINPVPVVLTGRTGVPMTVTFRTGTKTVVTGKGPITTVLYPKIDLPAQTVGNIAYKATGIEVGR